MTTTDTKHAEFVTELPISQAGRARARHWERVAAELRSRPGKWAIVLRNSPDHSLASRITRGKIRAFPPGEFEGAARRDRDGDEGWTIYARSIR